LAAYPQVVWLLALEMRSTQPAARRYWSVISGMSPGLQQLYDSLDDKQKAGLNRALRQVSHCGRAHEIAAAMTHFKRS
jgi:hypothetical protein